MVKRMGLMSLRPLQEKKQNLENRMKHLEGYAAPLTAAFNRFYDSLNGIRTLYAKYENEDIETFASVFAPMLVPSYDFGALFDALDAVIGGQYTTAEQQNSVSEWLRTTVPALIERSL